MECELPQIRLQAEPADAHNASYRRGVETNSAFEDWPKIACRRARPVL